MRRVVILAAVAVMAWAGAVQAQIRRAAPGPGMVSLPRGVSDKQGNQWMVYPGGYFQQQGHQPTYSQGAYLMVNGQQPASRVNMARLDEKTGELILEPMPVAQLVVTRRIKIDTEKGLIRFIDIFHNPTPQIQNANVVIRSSMNNGLQMGQPVTDPKSDGRQLGWVGLTHARQAVVQYFAGRGAKHAMQSNWPQGNNYVEVLTQLRLAPQQQVALVHVHSSEANTDSATKWIREMDDRALLSDVPRDVREKVVNFRLPQNTVGEIEVLRGEAFDVVELRGESEDQVRGTILESSYKLQTFYGLIELPVERVVAMIGVGSYRPRQLLVTVEGEIFGGELQAEAIRIQLTTGQETSIPLRQIRRFGYRKRAGEPEEWVFDKPMVVMQAGDRVRVTMPTEPIEVVSRYGRLSLDPAKVASIQMGSAEHGMHVITTIDGSRFVGLVTAERFDMTLAADGVSAQGTPVSFPAEAIQQIQFSPLGEENEDLGRMSLSNEDLLIGSLWGKLRLYTAFDVLEIAGPEVKGLKRMEGSGGEIQATLWDDSKVSGQFDQQAVEYRLDSGVVLRVPMALMEDYENPLPTPSPTVVEQIREVVAQLSADDWKARDRAEAKLLSMGVGVIRVLKEMRPSQPPEAQERIDGIIKQLEKLRQEQSAARSATKARFAAGEFNNNTLTPVEDW